VTREQFFTCFREIHALFHAHWSNAVGAPGYVKANWLQLDNELVRVWRDQATAIGIPRTEPLLRHAGAAEMMGSDVKCKACDAKLPLVWHVQSRKTMHLAPGLSVTSCARIDAKEQQEREARRGR